MKWCRQSAWYSRAAFPRGRRVITVIVKRIVVGAPQRITHGIEDDAVHRRTRATEKLQATTGQFARRLAGQDHQTNGVHVFYESQRVRHAKDGCRVHHYPIELVESFI